MSIEKTGFALIEVLIALTIVVISLFGLAILQLSILHNSQTTYWASLATLQVANMAERIKANSEDLQTEFVQWQEENKNLLPQGYGEVNCEKSNCTIKVIWYAEQKWQQFTLSM